MKFILFSSQAPFSSFLIIFYRSPCKEPWKYILLSCFGLQAKTSKVRPAETMRSLGQKPRPSLKSKTKIIAIKLDYIWMERYKWAEMCCKPDTFSSFTTVIIQVSTDKCHDSPYFALILEAIKTFSFFPPYQLGAIHSGYSNIHNSLEASINNFWH